ncbi:uncharacterized protein LAESUDRAFT_757489 [Laetiporus sulphureus 93-53]|uniref:non-specific serine/threonine protein kinase n=1 Tax=Laetiporus sulphureus 93-53 TaxID=1314785 RepID=A0A165FCY9_9APHY|nr:uncharacterized protein LAESUDRAFT_757489 [Laetiporus sulphureus 93-53]KZT08782.1 hypothetical protein LAESUDRAFT_757489 [Laetiporus sulphureus 93-53]
MAMAQAYPQAYMQQPNKGTLLPGQTIAVNRYTVQVERYLSQGGFAHVYLVKTAQPVHDTTYHVLKRIAVPNEGMLTEVKKEVDVMRILRGHPNIVYLIDAAWHRLSNGTYEVFILMEYCAGGGIIDMMNRRLRERLTEPEILTIFCDVCEGLAAMHSLKPPLIHRDLKVENILQASSTLYKLCDFGSATPVQRVPTNVQELRMLEADLNRHTTLQYRAPEMVDVYLRRPVDEKSDIWALGVLLYKLCYYTTPFEEHGPLAILNVQYKIPPYPVYSQQMNALIASMLREHGAQRPSVFEILAHVHRLRGTKSRFTYNVPSKEQQIPPRAVPTAPLQTLSPNTIPPVRQPANLLDDLVTYRPHQPSSLPLKSSSIEARDKVLDAIAPMRRGRPVHSIPSPPASPKQERRPDLDADRAHYHARGHKTGLATVNGTTSDHSKNDADAWAPSFRMERKPVPSLESDKKAFEKAFGDDFTSFGKSFGDFQPAKSPAPSPKAQPYPQLQPQSQPQPQTLPAPSPRPLPSTPQMQHQSMRRAKDAFDGLGLAAQPSPPTLGEARKSRTGLATFSSSLNSAASSSSAQYLSTASNQVNGLGTSNTVYRPPTSHSPLPPPSPQLQSQPPLSSLPPSMQPWRASRVPSSQGQPLSAEERFPSLEELDREFGSPPPPTPSKDRSADFHAPVPPSTAERPILSSRPPSKMSYKGGMRPTAVEGLPAVGTSAPSSHATTGLGKSRYDGVRSQHVTGTAMRESQSRYGSVARQSSLYVRPAAVIPPPNRDRESLREKERKVVKQEEEEKKQDVVAVLRSRPSAARRHRRPGDGKTPTRTESKDASSKTPTEAQTPALPPRPEPSNAEPEPRKEPRDWLTGADDEEPAVVPPRPPPKAESQPQPVLRDTPSKRASYVERSPADSQKPPEAERVAESPASEMMHERSARELRLERAERRERERDEDRRREESKRNSSSRSRGNISGTSTGAQHATGSSSSRGLQLPPVDTKLSSRSGITPSPSGLTENWSPIAASADTPSKRSPSCSSSDGGPEDVRRYVPRDVPRDDRRTRELERPVRQSSDEDRRSLARSKGRQGSVHNLVDLWGSNTSHSTLEQENTREKEKSSVSAARQSDSRRSVIMPSPSVRPPPLSAKTRSESRSESPRPLIDMSPTRSRMLPSQTTSSSQRSQPSISSAARRSTVISSPSLHTSGRSRPQSMFVHPIAKTSSTDSSASTSHAAARSAHQQQQQLSPPADISRRSMRRSSITDMVQHYEVIDSTAKAPGPSLSSKPAALSTKPTRLTGDSGSTVTSPSAAAQRFPKLSPPSSPVIPKPNLAVPDDAGQGRAERELINGGRASPSGLPSRASPVGRRDRSRSRPPAMSGLPSRRSPAPLSRPSFQDRSPQREEMSVVPRPVRRTTMPAEDTTSPPLRSPSPERPYQGVSKLIDRWNRAVDDSGQAPSHGPMKRGGIPARRVSVVGGESGRGRS